MTIDDVMLSEGAVVTVRDGILVSDVVATSTTRPDEVVHRPRPVDDPTDSRGRGRTSTTPGDATRGESPLPPDVRRPTDRDRPADATRDGTRELDPPTVTDPTHPVDTPTDDTPTDDTPTVDTRTDGAHPRLDGVPLGIALRLFADDGHVRVVWRVQGVGDEPWAVVVVRTDDGTDPDWPVAGGAVVGEGPSGEIVERRRDFPDIVTSLRYRVLVVDRSDGVVARGAVQTLSGQ